MGFEPRSSTAIRKRAYAYEIMRENSQPSNVPRQVLMVYATIAHEHIEIHQCVKAYIKEHYSPNESLEISNEHLSDLVGGPNNLMGYQHTIDFQQTFPMVLQKYVELKKIKKHNAMCKSIGMKPDTFSAILRGKYGDVKKDNVLRLCIGLQLSVSEAEELLNSAGFMLSNAIMTDVVIKAFLWNRIYGVVAINMELEENNAPMLFHDYEIDC
jgi:DNA-binding Xre family transcriptional regulator